MSNKRTSAPPQLMFDDGSRIMTAEVVDSSRVALSPRGSMAIDEYYETSRLSEELVSLMKNRSVRDGFSCRVALQFPDDLLKDSPDVCWAFEKVLSDLLPLPPLVFCLGDTTFGPCCPDEVSALHLQADVLIHYGHACLSPALSLPVLYGFGITNMNVEDCVNSVLHQAKQDAVDRILLLYEVRYRHAMETLKLQLSERGDLLVVMGEIPETASNAKRENQSRSSEGCCTEQIDPGETVKHELEAKDQTLIIGGLEVPRDVDLSLYTLLFVGDPSDDAGSSSRQYVNTMLRFISDQDGAPSNLWTYSPLQKCLNTFLPRSIQRQLNRRFYLVQKARDASRYGILVGTLSQRHFRSVVSRLQQMIEAADRACYVFAVGKINGAKLANFAEIECFVLVACSENSLLDNERDLHVPVITPQELDMALGNVEWGSRVYSLDYNHFLTTNKDANEASEKDNNKEADAPYFSLVTGKYETSKKLGTVTNDVDLASLPGKGQMTEYKSVAADFLKTREYTGLTAQVGQTKVQAAIEGQTGIASDYGCK